MSFRASVRSRLCSSMQDGLTMDIAVIGAGVSGLYTAMRLTETSKVGTKRKSVQVFKASGRIGGRLESVILPGTTAVIELGAMRFLTDHEIIKSLVEKKFRGKLNHVPFSASDSGNTLFYARGRRCLSNAWVDSQNAGQMFRSQFFLPSHLEGFNYDQLCHKIVYDVLTQDAWFLKNYHDAVSHTDKCTYDFTLTNRQWNVIKLHLVYNFEGSPYNGIKVNDLGIRNVIKDQIGEEGYNYISVATGFDYLDLNFNAVRAFEILVREETAEASYRAIEGGYDLLAYVMAEWYLNLPGSKIWIENALVSFDRQPEGSSSKYMISLRNGKTGQIWTAYADAVILAMPQRSLELISQNTALVKINSVLQMNINSVHKTNLSKLIMVFKLPWWKDLDIIGGRSVTDLPMRQCYYFPSDSDNGPWVFIASYADLQNVTFWQALENEQPGNDDFRSGHRHGTTESDPDMDAGSNFSPPNDDIPAGNRQRTSESDLDSDVGSSDFHPATRAMIAEALNQVRELHGLRNIPKPHRAFYKDWSKDPFGGGYHLWKAGVNVEDVMRYMRKPIDGEEVHICGEAYSANQGWVEGALVEAEKMVQEHFGLSTPSWLVSEYYLGC